jgi:hypothetical protein
MGAENFGKELKNKGLFKEELPAIVASDKTDEEKLVAILDLVRSKVKWNEQTTMGIDKPSKALKEGVGTSGEINSLLFNALRNAGYSAGAVVMSLRSHGRLPKTYPSSDNFNYFVVQVVIGDKTYYMDATRPYCDLNVIPVDCLVENALCIQEKTFNWVNLTKLGNNAERSSLIVSFNEDGFLSGRRTKSYMGESIFSFKNSYEKAKDEAEFIQTTETNNAISLTDYKIDEKRNPNFSLVESYQFTRNDLQLGDNDILMIPPLLFETMKSNPFKSEERTLPIEFPYPVDERINVNITLPEGYAVDEAPASGRFVYGDDNLFDFSYMVQASDRNVQIAYRFKVNTSIVPATEYAGIRDFWSKVYAKCNEMIILKKL